MISHLAVVQTQTIGTNVTIHEFSVVRENVSLGNNVTIHPHVVIESGVSIGDNVEIFPGAYVGKTPKGAGVLSRPINFEPVIFIGANSSIGPQAVIYYDVHIGNNTLIGDGASIREQCRIGNFNILGRYVTINYSVQTGNHVRIMDHSWLAGNMIIEDDVAISGGVYTTNDNGIGKDYYQEHIMQGAHIKHGARIGAGAVLLPNITLGRGSVVAAGSVVTKNVNDYTLVMGSPARCIRMIEEAS